EAKLATNSCRLRRRQTCREFADRRTARRDDRDRARPVQHQDPRCRGDGRDRHLRHQGWPNPLPDGSRPPGFPRQSGTAESMLMLCVAAPAAREETMNTSERTVSDALIELLLRLGVRSIYGIIGGAI